MIGSIEVYAELGFAAAAAAAAAAVVAADSDLMSHMVAVCIAQTDDEAPDADDDMTPVGDEPAEEVEGPDDIGLRETPCWQAGVGRRFCC